MTNSVDSDQKPTDLDLHCLLRQGMWCSAREELKSVYIFFRSPKERRSKKNRRRDSDSSDDGSVSHKSRKSRRPTEEEMEILKEEARYELPCSRINSNILVLLLLLLFFFFGQKNS